MFAYWVGIDSENINLLRFGLLRFRMPDPYKVNEIPSSITELGNAIPDDDKYLQRGSRTLAESVACVGGQLGRRGDRKAVLLAALLVDQIQKDHAHLFKPTWQGRLPGELAMIVSDGLDEHMPKPRKYRHAGFDAVIKALYADPLVDRFLNGGPSAHPSVAGDEASPRC